MADEIRLAADFSGLATAAHESAAALDSAQKAARELYEATEGLEKAQRVLEKAIDAGMAGSVEYATRLRDQARGRLQDAEAADLEARNTLHLANVQESAARTAAALAHAEQEAVARAHELAAQAARAQAVAEQQAATTAESAMDAQVRAAMAATAAQRQSRVGIVADQAAVRAAVGETSVAVAGGGYGGKGGLAGAALQASYAFQDFSSVLGTQGFGRAIASVQNNLPIILMYLGAGMGITGVASGAAVAAGLLAENWDKVESAFGGSAYLQAVPEALDRIEALTGALKDQKEELEKLAKQRMLDMREIDRYRELQHKVAAETEDLAIAKKARSIAGESPENKKYGAAFRKAAGSYGGSERLVDDLVALGMEEAAAERLVVGAMEGHKDSINAILRKTVPFGQRAFSQFWNPVDPVTVEQAKHNEKEKKAGLALQKKAADQKKREDERHRRKVEAALKRRTERDVAKLEAMDKEQFQGRMKAAHEEFAGAMKVAGATDLQDRATAMAAQMRLAGGYEDEFGRWHRASSLEQNHEIQRRVSRELDQRFGMKGMVRTGVAGAIGTKAGRQVDQALEGAQRQAAAQGTEEMLTQTRALQGMVGTLNQGVRRIQQRNQLLESDVRRTVQQGQTAMNMGGPN